MIALPYDVDLDGCGLGDLWMPRIVLLYNSAKVKYAFPGKFKANEQRMEACRYRPIFGIITFQDVLISLVSSSHLP